VNNLCNSLVQTLTPDAVRGRVMGIYLLMFFGFAPVGSLLAGLAAEHLGEHPTVGIAAAVMMAAALGISIAVPRVRRLE
jgi:MFS family permease